MLEIIAIAMSIIVTTLHCTAVQIKRSMSKGTVNDNQESLKHHPTLATHGHGEVSVDSHATPNFPVSTKYVAHFK